MDGSELVEDIDSELARTQAQSLSLKGRSLLTLPAAVMLSVLAVLNVITFLVSPFYGNIWIASTLLVALILSVVAFLPTTRSTTGIGGIFVPIRKLRNVTGTNKKVLAALLLSSFLVGGVPMVPGMIVLLGGSILFALAALLTVPGLFFPMVWIIVQCILMIGFYIWLTGLRPYSADFLDHVMKAIFALKHRGKRRMVREEIELGLLIMISAVVLIGVLVLPGFSLKIVTLELGNALVWYLVPFLIVMATQMLVVRGWQSSESRKWAWEFLENKRNILQGLRAEAAMPGADLEQLRERLLVTRIMRLQSHDLFGYLPIYSFFPDLEILLTKDLQDELSRITPSDALRMTGF